MFRKRPSALRIAILGCGPTGLFAAHAFASMGYGGISILSRKRRSEMFGAQYLHDPIPGLSEEEGISVRYSLQGRLEDYAAKVYGGKVNPSITSPGVLGEEHTAWDIRKAYYHAWEVYQDRITDVRIHPSMLPEIIDGFDLVVSTIPARDICKDLLGHHKFEVQKVWAIGDAPERGVFCPITVPSFSIVCNGNPSPRWYRASNVFGYRTAEWPEGPKPPVDNVASVEKPISTNCDCWLGKNFMRAGRYGTWTKGVLSHQVYADIKGWY